jgi:pyridoxal phosphate enzyme (YggS family)
VNGAPPEIRDRLEAVRDRIGRAAARSGRASGQVTLVGASKTVPAGVLREAIALGLRDLGENRVQEAAAKIAELGRDAVRWHLIGHLQRNKAAKAVECFDFVHSVDDVELATELARRATAAGRVLPVLVEVNVSGESSKFGVTPDGLDRLLEAIRPLEGVRLAGLMTVGRPVERAEDARGDFVRLRELRDRGERVTGLPLPELSMGMSGDYEVAVEEGATLVRVGAALFGPRTATK